MELNFAYSAPLHAGSHASQGGHRFAPGRPKATTFQDWRHALAGQTAAAPSHREIVVSAMPAMPAPIVLPDVPKEASRYVEWNLARTLFQSRQDSDICLATERGTYSTEGEWNDLPSRVETFLHSSQTKQTVTGIAFLVMLLLWAI